MSSGRIITLSTFEDNASTLGVGGSDMRSRLQKGDAVFIDAVAEGRFTQGASPKLQGMGHVFTNVLFALFVVVLLIAIAVGTTVYRTLYDENNATDDARLSTSLLANTIRINDTIDSVMSGQGPEGPALVLIEHGNGEVYQTRIYQDAGAIVEEYTLASNPYDPARATKLCDSDSFAFDYKNGLLTVWTDDGTVEVALRSARRAV